MGMMLPTPETIEDMKEAIARGEAPLCPARCYSFSSARGVYVGTRMVHPDPPHDKQWICPECDCFYDEKGDEV